MAPQASFFKLRDRTILLLDRTRDGSFSKPGQPSFQMVPHRGAREFQVAVSGGRVRILGTGSLSNIAKLRFPPNNQPFLDIDTSALQEITFTIEGENPGRGAIVAEDVFGNRLDTMFVSVKLQRPITYNTHVLSDTKMTANGERILTVMQAVEDVYLNQANVRLEHVNKMNLLAFNDISLGNNLVFGARPKPSNGTTTVHETIRQRIKEGGFDQQDRNMVFTWDIKDDPGFRTLGFTPDTVGYIEDNPVVSEMIATAAHEFGHSMNLAHDKVDPDVMMFDGSPRSLAFRKQDIDQVNPSGT